MKMEKNSKENAVISSNNTEEGRDPSMHLPAVRTDASTLNELIDFSCSRFPSQPALGFAQATSLTYKEMQEGILSVAARLQAEGVVSGSRVAILGENSPAWAMAYLAVVRLGAVGVPIYPETPASDVRHILRQTEAEVLFVTGRQLDKIYDVDLPLQKIISLDDAADSTGILALFPFSTCMAEGQLIFADGESVFPEVQPDDLASILYTSGASGFSKAVLLSHANFCANANSASRVMGLSPGDVFLSVLPVSHAYEFTVGFLLPLLCGCRIVYAGKTPTPAVLQQICAYERPQVMLIVPLVMEKIFKKHVLARIEKSKVVGFVSRFDMGRKLIYKNAGAKLLQFFGGRIKLLGIGGAGLNPKVERFLRDGGIPFLAGYGLSEAAPLLAGGPYLDEEVACGSVGKAISGVEIRISDPDVKTGIGEIMARGTNVMQGYLNDPEATQQAITEDGWLKTGDLGRLDNKGNLFIEGRLKSVIVLASGENVYPEVIEHRLNAYPIVEETLVVEKHGMLEALIYPNIGYIDAKTKGMTTAARQEYVRRTLSEIRRDINETLPLSSRLSKAIERPEPFEKTATHKIKRYLY